MNKSDLIRIINEEINYTLDEAESTTVNEVVDPIYNSNFPEIVAGMITVGIAIKQIVKFLAHKGLNRDQIEKLIKGEDNELNEDRDYFGKDFYTKRGYLGVNIRDNKPRLLIRRYQNNPYGGSPWKLGMKDRAKNPEELTKEYILSQVGEIYKDPESFSSDVDELISMIKDYFKI